LSQPPGGPDGGDPLSYLSGGLSESALGGVVEMQESLDEDTDPFDLESAQVDFSTSSPPPPNYALSQYRHQFLLTQSTVGVQVSGGPNLYGQGGAPTALVGAANSCPNGGKPVKMLVTGYDNSFQSTGKNPGDPGYGMTANGSVAAYGTIAAPSNYPFGTRMSVPGYGLGTVLDRGGAIRNSHIDLWFPTTQQAINWGPQHLTVTVCH